MSQTHNHVPYQMPQTANQQFNPITVYATRNQGQRPPSAPVTTQTSQQLRREKHPLQTIDPNTGKDTCISTDKRETNTPPARATPPGSVQPVEETPLVVPNVEIKTEVNNKVQSENENNQEKTQESKATRVEK